MKKALALVVIAFATQSLLLASWEHEEIIKNQDYHSGYALDSYSTSKYTKISLYSEFDRSKIGHDLRAACELAPRGWISKNTVEAACDVLYNQFDAIDEQVKKDFENNQLLDCSTRIKEEDARDLIGIILNLSTDEKAVHEAWNRLNDDYAKHRTDALRKKKLSELSKKYQN